VFSAVSDNSDADNCSRTDSNEHVDNKDTSVALLGGDDDIEMTTNDAGVVGDNDNVHKTCTTETDSTTGSTGKMHKE
jgi:hypothetical protein